MVNQLKIIKPNSNDLTRIAQLYIECFNAPDKGENWTMETALSYFRDRINEDSIFGIFEHESELMGVCCGSPYDGSAISHELELMLEQYFYISLVAVRAQFQGQGLGRAMMEQFEDIIQKRGFLGIVVRCRGSNKKMINLLERSRYQRSKQYEAELGGVKCERVVFSRSFALLADNGK